MNGRPQSPLSDQDESPELALQEEYDRLQYQCKKSEYEKTAFIKKTRALMKKYSEEMTYLVKDNEELKLNLSLVESDYNKRRDLDSLTNLRGLASVNEQILFKIEQEMNRQIIMNAEIKKYEKRLNQCQLNGDTKLLEEMKRLTHKKHVLENQLGQQNQLMGSAFARNREIRKHIDTLHSERVVLSKKLTELSLQFERINRKKNELTQDATIALDKREEIGKKINAFKKKNIRENSLFVNEIRNLSRIIDHNSNLENFMQVKSTNRSHLIEIFGISKEKNEEASLLLQKKRTRILVSYNEIFTKIQETINATNLNGIVENFKRNEGDISSHFEYLNSINLQNLQLTELINKTMQEIEEFKKRRATQIEEFHAKMRIYEKEYTTSMALSEETQKPLEEAWKTLKELQEGIQTLFKSAKCHQEGIKHPLLSDEKVMTSEKSMLLLKAVELEVDHMLEYYEFIDERKRGEKSPHVNSEADAASRFQETDASEMFEEIDDDLDERSSLILPSLGEEFDEYSVDSGMELQPITKQQLMRLIKS